METYKAVVESGSCSTDYKHWEERTNCGHNHKSVDLAQRCLDRKQRRYCNHGRRAGTPCRGCLGYAQSHSTSALWYNGTIHNNANERLR